MTEFTLEGLKAFDSRKPDIYFENGVSFLLNPDSEEQRNAMHRSTEKLLRLQNDNTAFGKKVENWIFARR